MDPRYLEVVAGLSIGYASYELYKAFRSPQARIMDVRIQAVRAVAGLLFMAYWAISAFVSRPLLHQTPGLLGLTVVGLGSGFLNRWARASAVRRLPDGHPAVPTVEGAAAPASGGKAPADL